MNRLKKAYEEDYLLYWTNISRATTLLIILNISMFFLTGLVTTQRYFYTFFSIVALSVVLLGGILPLGYHRSFKVYIFFLAFEFIGAYFLIASAWYWVITNRV